MPRTIPTKERGWIQVTHQQLQPRRRRHWALWPHPQRQTPSGMHRLVLIWHTNHCHRNVCMRHWTEHQTGGQSLLSNFNEYFKSLNDAAKEVRLFSYIPVPQGNYLSSCPKPFKKEMHIVQAATVSSYHTHVHTALLTQTLQRRTNLATKKANGIVPSAT